MAMASLKVQRQTFLFIIVTGTPVYAKWRDKCLYPGKIISKEGQKYMVEFEDGDRMKVRWQDILICNLLPVDTEVLAEDHDGVFVSAVVKSVETHSPEGPGYTVQLLKERIIQRYFVLINSRGLIPRN